MSTILDALRRLQREQEAAGAERELRQAVTTETPLPEERRPSRAPVWLVSAGVLLLALGGAGYWWLGKRSLEPQPTAPDVVARAPAEPAPRPFVEPRPAPAVRRAPPAPVPTAVPAPAPPPQSPAVTGAPEAPDSRPGAPVAALPAPAPAPVHPPAPQRASPPAPPPERAPVPAPSKTAAPAPAPAPPAVAKATPPQPEPEPAQRPARIQPVRVPPARAKSAESSKPPSPEQVAEKPAPAPAELPAPSARPAPPSTEDLPDLKVVRLRWHPDARRRTAVLELDLRQVDDAREGDILAGVRIEEIQADAIVVRTGEGLHRIPLAP